jgi:cyclophilin family peptidyl-prolyl cis-trans isomerase
MTRLLLLALLTGVVLTGLPGCTSPEPAPTHDQLVQQEREAQAAAIAKDEEAKAAVIADAKAKQEQLEAEQAAVNKAAAEELAKVRAAEEARTAEKLAAERAAAERLAAEQAANEKAAADAAAKEAAEKTAAMAAEQQRQAQADAALKASKAKAAAEAAGIANPAQAPVVSGEEQAELARLVAEVSTSKGTLVLSFRADKAPRHVKNFVELSRKGFYDGLTFHRIKPGFLIQGGDPKGDGSGGPGYRIPAELSDLRHVRGTLSMSRESHPDTAGSQFFICLADDPRLDGQYSAFGQLASGWETLDAIAAVGSAGGTPSETVRIEKIVIRPAQPGELPAP